jgi:hypothetical protein
MSLHLTDLTQTRPSHRPATSHAPNADSATLPRVIRKVATQPEEIEPLRLLSLLEPGAQIGVEAGEHSAAFLNKIRTGLDKSLMSPGRLHGWRVQEMFQAMVVSLGRFQIFKLEDSGACYFDDTAGGLAVPDFRLVTSGDESLLIEVKNVAPKKSTKITTSMRAVDVERLQRYAQRTKARLMFAHYWAELNVWTLVDAMVPSRQGSKVHLGIEDAMKANELVAVGDRFIATRPPLAMSLVADRSKERGQLPAAGEREVYFTIGSVELECDGTAIEDETERRIAITLMIYGGWPSEPTVQTDDDGKITQIEYVARPPVDEEKIEAQDFASVGTLSSLYSTSYNAATLNDDGTVIAVGQTIAPGAMASLIPPDYWEKKDRALPLWIFELHPSTAPVSHR